MSACVEMTAVCLIGRMASTWSRRWRVPRGVSVAELMYSCCSRVNQAKLQALFVDDYDVILAQNRLLDLAGRVLGELAHHFDEGWSMRGGKPLARVVTHTRHQ